jgi:hypothetical protein
MTFSCQERTHAPAQHSSVAGSPEVESFRALLVLLRNRFSATDLKTLAIDRIALFGQDDANSRFKVLSHHFLRD